MFFLILFIKKSRFSLSRTLINIQIISSDCNRIRAAKVFSKSLPLDFEKESLQERHMIGSLSMAKAILCSLATLPAHHMRLRLMSRAPWNIVILSIRWKRTLSVVKRSHVRKATQNATIRPRFNRLLMYGFVRSDFS